MAAWSLASLQALTSLVSQISKTTCEEGLFKKNTVKNFTSMSATILLLLCQFTKFAAERGILF